MKPKVESAAQFVEGGGKLGVICALADAGRALVGEAGTQVSH
jgi:carbamate kinase